MHQCILNCLLLARMLRRTRRKVLRRPLRCIAMTHKHSFATGQYRKRAHLGQAIRSLLCIFCGDSQSVGPMMLDGGLWQLAAASGTEYLCDGQRQTGGADFETLSVTVVGTTLGGRVCKRRRL